VTPTPAPDADDTLPKVKLAFDEATATAAEAKTATSAFEALATELATTTAAPAHDDTTTKHVEELATSLGEAAAKLDTVAAKLEAAADAAADAAGASPSPDAAKLVADARALAQGARAAATAARGKTAAAADKARKYVTAETGDPQMFIAAADAAIASGEFTDAKQNLDKAAKRIRASGAKTASLDYSYAQLYDKMAARTKDPATKRKLLQQASASYQRFANTGTGPRVQRANDRLTEIADEIKEFGPP